MAIKSVLVEIALVETVLVGDPLYKNLSEWTLSRCNVLRRRDDNKWRNGKNDDLKFPSNRIIEKLSKQEENEKQEVTTITETSLSN